ncbi:MAG: LysE family transporter [Coprothermobacterota bacterium]|nr:LysE family transporter [Coprothermobacterota bacterium]
MDGFSLFWRGLWLGFSIAAPVGPIGLLCIQRTLNGGMTQGFVSGLGAASADAVYGAVAALGLASLASFLTSVSFWVQLVGSLFLLTLGVRIFFLRPATIAIKSSGSGLLASYGSTFLLTLANPMTILSFLAVFAGIGLARTSTGYIGAGWTVAGVFLGSACWWLFLSAVTGLLRKRVTSIALFWLNRFAGCLLAGFAIYLLVSLWR